MESRANNGGRETPAAVVDQCKPLLMARYICLLRFHPEVQATPLTVKAVGEVLPALQVPWNPNEVEPPAGTLPL